MYDCMLLYVYVPGVSEGQKRAPDSLELGLQKVFSTVWVLGIRRVLYKKTNALHHGAILQSLKNKL